MRPEDTCRHRLTNSFATCLPTVFAQLFPRNPPRLVASAAPGTPRCNPIHPDARAIVPHVEPSTHGAMPVCLSAAPWPPAYPRHIILSPVDEAQYLLALATGVPEPAGCPGTPTTKSASHPLSTHIREYRAPEEPSLHFASLRCRTSCTPLLVSAGQTLAGYLPTHTLSSLRHLAAARAGFAASQSEFTPHPLSTQMPSSS